MSIFVEAVNYIIHFKPYVMLPIIIFIFSLMFHIPVYRAIKSSLTIGIGFVGIFVIFGFFVENIGPAVEALIARTGLHFDTLDVGWTPLAAIAWSSHLSLLLLVLIMVLNITMLMFRWTRTVNIDIWNYWHFIFMGVLVHEATGNGALAVSAALIACAVTLKLADWSAPSVKRFSGLTGISISTLSGVVYYPLGVVGEKLLEKVPLLNRIQADPKSIKKKLGVIGEPITIGFVMGVVLGIGAGYETKLVLELAFGFAAVIYILPMMAGILTKGLMPISDGMKEYLEKKFPHMGEHYIGLDLAVLLGDPAVVVTGLFLMPAAILLAFIIPGVNFIPLGDLVNIIGAMMMVVVACSGNIIRAFMISVPILIGKIIIASRMARLYTALAHKANMQFEGYSGQITSFLDGGNVFRFWLLKVCEGNWWAISSIVVLSATGYVLLKREQIKQTPAVDLYRTR